MNPFATGTSAGHAPRIGATESTRSANAPRIVQGRIAKMRRRREREDGAARGDIRADSMKRGEGRTKEEKEEGESEKEEEEARGYRKVVRQNGAATAPAGDLYRIISPSECLHF